MNKYLLETSTLSLLMKDILEVKGRLNSLTESDYIFTCPIVKGEILFWAQEQGTPLDECDLWIAATALTLDAILVTSDSD
ncbi:MAG: hypothetical protein OXU27_09035 [Candidatus Poribacteria bacterium]|nr:hypothetical protein [Candidatus Poribacteria bacterium]